ncbi:iron chelate uptake ABC transporter family permease subunit [Micropruina sp.]|uniref:FecCD family ABC transporter permease n=1 Tax=Micropruina sp. TaxID=2737536 RepID=UPI00261E80F2|nr:iron chelate uptake ABC transporter family permease subunit [Micropruina sp.]
MTTLVDDPIRPLNPRAGSVPVPLIGGWSPARGLVVTTVVTVIALALAVVALGLGDLPLSPGEVVQALFATDGSFTSTVVRDWRLPRVLGALVFGSALAVSGAVFQSLTRNPLGSPDVIGFATGAYTGALVALTVVGAGAVSASAGALVGGLLTAVVVYLLAYRRGMQGFRLIIVGIAVTAMLHAANLFLLLRAQQEVAMAAAIWGAGSLSLLGWPTLIPAIVGLLLCTPGLLLVPGLRQLELGDDAAAGHGVAVERVRVGLVLFAVALVAIVTASTGPIAFVALAAPQVARRLARSAGIPLVSSAAVGALLMLGADLIAQHVLPVDVPVGIVTVVLGGVYLLTLLVQEARNR